MKVTVIGAGSTYTPELIQGFINFRETFPLSELCLMDITPYRLQVVGGLVQRIIKAQGAPFKVSLCLDQKEALHGASYVITQLRVGGMEARRKDEYLGQRYHLIGQETTGIGGMSKALRTIPVILEIAEQMRELAPDALLVNFTNPAGLITEALEHYFPDVSSVGVCNVPYNAEKDIVDLIKTNSLKTELDTLGLNHLSWHRGFLLDDVDIWTQVLDKMIVSLKNDPDEKWQLEVINNLGLIPNYYLKYYYDTTRQLERQSTWPPSRAEEVIKIEASLLQDYRDPLLITPPDNLLKRGGAYYSTVAVRLLNAHYNDLGERQVLNTRQNGAVSGYPDDWVMEMPCRVDRKGIHSLPTQPLPEVCFGLIALVKSYELLTIQAAVNGDKQTAFQALLAHPLGPDIGSIDQVLDEMLKMNKDYLPQFSLDIPEGKK